MLRNGCDKSTINCERILWNSDVLDDPVEVLVLATTVTGSHGHLQRRGTALLLTGSEESLEEEMGRESGLLWLP